MVKSIPGSGTYVAMSESQGTVDLIASFLGEKTDNLKEIFQLRRIIEPQVAGMAAKNACEGNLKRLNQLLIQNKEFLEQDSIDPQKFLQFDKELHQVIAIAAQNSIIPKLLERIRDLFSESRHESYQSKSRMKISAKGHIDLIQAILGKNDKNSIDLMEKHLIEVEAEAIRQLVSTSLPETIEDTEKK
jgi:GntR family transcriptional repressor for pyruvate dehydrogenase complex